MAEEKKTSNALEILFPEKEVKTGDGLVVCKVHPLSLEDIPKVSEAFARLARLVDNGLGPAELATTALKELSTILPLCIDKPAKEVPATFTPDLVTHFIDQNMTEPDIKKWNALVDRVTALSEKAKGQLNPGQTTPTS